MKKLLLSLGAVGVMLALFASPTVSADSDVPVAIVVSPNVLNLDSQGTWVTVHTDIPYADVDRTVIVTLNGVEVKVVKSDACGDLVAKFCIDDIIGIVQPGTATLTLFGTTVWGIPFSGSDTIKVIQQETRKK